MGHLKINAIETIIFIVRHVDKSNSVLEIFLKISYKAIFFFISPVVISHAIFMQFFPLNS